MSSAVVVTGALRDYIYKYPLDIPYIKNENTRQENCEQLRSRSTSEIALATIHLVYFNFSADSKLDARPNGDQEVAGSIPAGSGNILPWRMIMKYFLLSSSPFR